MDQKDLLSKIELHGEWLSSLGKTGEQIVLNDADFSGLDLAGVDLFDSILPGANFSHCNLTGANIGGANVTYASFVEANLTSANLLKAVFDEARFDYATMHNVRCFRSTFYGTSFFKADMENANLVRAQIVCANLEQANLRNADLDYLYIKECRFYLTNMYNIQHLETALVDSIDIGSVSSPEMLDADKAKEWLKHVKRHKASSGTENIHLLDSKIYEEIYAAQKRK